MRACPRCSTGSLKTYHGRGTACERDPRLPVNVIAAYFHERNPEYVGVVWAAVANGCLRALETGGFKLTKQRKRASLRRDRSQ